VHSITLFPPYGIDQTIHVAILIGVLWLLFFTESFGWVFSGLVVPGYLASLFVLEPASAIAVLIEAVLTFLVARLVSNLASRSGAWSAFFGRERFLLLIFVSIAVRQACELWLLKDALRVIDDMRGTSYRLTYSLSSVGLVLVPLTANSFWKLDLRRGLFQIAVPTALTFAMLAYVLLPYTNLSFSRLELSYENVALDFLSSPKAYILLVTGAYLGSRYNLLYGWDYAGVLVPALLGLAWLSPHRLVTTLAETLLLVLCVRLLVRAPYIRTMNLEGPRKVALVFLVSFVLKWLLGWFVGPRVSGFPITDLFGFGYLLSSLLAVKILQKDTTPRILVPTFLVSIGTLVVGSLVGFSLDKVAPAPPPVARVEPAAMATPTTTVLARSATGVLALGHVRARLGVANEVPLAHGARELARYRELWTAIGAWLSAPSEPKLRDVERRADELGLVLQPIERVGSRDAWALFELEERLGAHVGWDTAVLVPGAPGPIVAVPSPAREAPSAEVGAALCERVGCRAVIVSGTDTGRNGDRAAHNIARSALRASELEVRVDPTLARGRAVLHVGPESPDINVSALWPHGLELSWKSARDGRWGASVLRANPDDFWQVIVERATPMRVTRGVSVEAWFAERFAHADASLSPTPDADIGASLPSQSELRFLELVVAPAALARNLAGAHAMAQLVGYSVEVLADGVGDNTPCWLVAETAKPRRLGWGVLAGRVADSAPLAIEAPRPRREGGTWRLAVELFRHADAASLIVADADVPPDRADADPAAAWNVATAFQAFHQAVHDARRATPDATILQIRGFGITQPVREPVVVMFPRALPSPDRLPKYIAALVGKTGALSRFQPVRFDSGARELVDLAGTGNPQLQYCTRFETTTCALLWFSEAARDEYRDVDRDRELAKLARMNVRITNATATAALLESPAGDDQGPPALAPPDAAHAARLRAKFAELGKLAETFALERNVHLLRRMPAVTAGYSDELGRPFLLIELRDGDHVIRGLVPIPAGTENVALDAGDDTAKLLPELLAQRPRSITVVGRSK